MPFVYIVRCADGSFYTGWTTDVVRRVGAHNAGRGARYTRSRRPVRLVYVEPCADRAAAQHRERAIKRLGHRAKGGLARAYRSRDRRGRLPDRG